VGEASVFKIRVNGLTKTCILFNEVSGGGTAAQRLNAQCARPGVQVQDTSVQDYAAQDLEKRAANPI
jgi:outer membrane murein-binding lipoprotein Lpp